MDNYFDKAAGQWDKDPMKVDRAAATARKIQNLGLSTTRSVVDFGGGTGLLGVHLKDTFEHVYLVDSSREMLRVADEKIAQANIGNISTHCVDQLSKLRERFSAVTTLMVLHHINDIKGFLAEVFSSLEEHGTLIIGDLYKEDGSFHKHSPSFSGHNGFDTSELSEWVGQAGFGVESVEQYFEIWKENYDQEVVSYPLFLLVAKKQG